MIRADLGHDVGGLKGGSGRFEALVTRTAACSLNSLVQAINRQHSKANRQPMTHRHLPQSAGGLTGHIIEVRRLATDYCS
jgi:hypothetical protein